MTDHSNPHHVLLAWSAFMANEAFAVLKKAYDMTDENRFESSLLSNSNADNETTEPTRQVARFLIIQLHLHATQKIVLPIAQELLDPQAELPQRLGLVASKDTSAIDHQRLEQYFCLAINPTSDAAQIRFNRRLWRLSSVSSTSSPVPGNAIASAPAAAGPTRNGVTSGIA